MTLAASLIQLETSGLLRLAQTEPELEYLFRHALIQDAAYESLLKADRRILHRAIGETLERLYPEQLSELAPTLGQHFAAAGEAEQARKYFVLAGDYALAQYANVEAEQHFRAALNWATSEANKAWALSGLGKALSAQSRFGEAIQTWREGNKLYQTFGDEDSVARLYARMSRAASEDGDTPGGLALCREGLAVVAAGPETPGIAALFHEAARACYFNGLPDESHSLCQQALEIAERVGDVETQAEALITLGFALQTEATSVLTRAVALAESARLLSTAARAHHNLGVFLVISIGDFHAGRDHLLRSVELNQQMGATSSEFFSLYAMNWPLLLLGDFADGDETLLKMRQLLPALANPDPYVLLLRFQQAVLLSLRGEWQAAIQSLRACQAELRQRGDLQHLIDVDNHLAETLLELGEWEEAGNVAAEVIEIGAQMGGSVWPRCLLSAVRSYEGRIEDARRLLTEAHRQVGQHPNVFDEESLSLAEARLATAERRWPEAMAGFEATASIQAKIEERWYHAQTLREWAEAHLSRAESGDLDRARELLRESLALFEEMNVPKYATLVRERLEHIG